MFYIPVHKLSFTSKSKRAVTLYNILEENLIAFNLNDCLQLTTLRKRLISLAVKIWTC